MSILGFVAIVFALGIFLWFGPVYLPVDPEGRRFPDRNGREAALPIPIPVGRAEHRG